MMSVLDPRAAGARRFERKVAVVAGAGQGIGSATARRLAEEGASVVVADLIEASANRIRDELCNSGASAATFVGDLSEWKNCQALMEYAKNVYGRIDVLINIVGGTIWWQTFEHYAPHQIQAEVNKSLWPTMWLCRSVLPHMLEQRSGAIVNLSTHAVVGKFRVPYAASKGGVMALTTSLAKEVAAYGIRVNCVAPSGGLADDRVTPRSYGVSVPNPDDYASSRGGGLMLREDLASIERYMQEERRVEVPMLKGGLATEQASAIAFLASDDASFITGQILPVGGGASYPY